MAEHREVSRSGGGARGERRSAGRPSEFVGYEQTEVLTAIVALNDLGDGTFEAKLERSPFYPAGGGQVTDAGWIEHEETGARGRAARGVPARRRPDARLRGRRLRRGRPRQGGRALGGALPDDGEPHGDAPPARVAAARARRARPAGGLRRAPDKLRFDFTHEQALTAEERAEVEELVNEQVFADRPCATFETPIDEARRLGAQMLFGEKYGDIVRVVEIDGFSRELCGGTHVRSTAEIGPFVILSEGSVGSGARRIEAVTSGEAFALLHERARGGRRAARRAREGAQGGEEGRRRRRRTAPTSPSRARPRPATSPSSSSTSRAATRSTSPTS